MDNELRKMIESLTDDLLPILSLQLAEFMKEDGSELGSDLHSTLEQSIKLMQKINNNIPNSHQKSNQIESASEKNYRDLLAINTTSHTEPIDKISNNNLVTDELSDEEAQMLLADMDAPLNTMNKSDNLNEISTQPDNNSEISDDEAKRLLEQMDSPSLATDSNCDAISDDEAQMLLAEMDSPILEKHESNINKPDQENITQRKSADEEAFDLLEKLGGKEDSTSVPEPMAESEVNEIPEWTLTDFQSDPDMIADFNNNTAELMDTLDEAILKLEGNPEDKEIIESIFRAAHTLKGAAGMFGFTAIERIMHRMENLFDLVRKGKLIPNSDTIDVVFEGIDLLKILLEAVKNGKPCGEKTAHVVHALDLVASGKTRKKSDPGGNTKKPESPTSAAKEKPKEANKKEQSTIRVDLKKLDILVNLVGELVIDRTRFVSIEEDLRSNHPQIKLAGNISETVQLFGRHMNEIQDIIMKVRMVPIGNAFNKFTRIVRDLSKSLGKKIELHIAGENAELDKTLVEQIGDPLIHLIRNSCDHGIENPEDRVSKGKKQVGHIFLSAIQEGNHIVIKIIDDGKGIDAEIIRRKGIEKGLITEEQDLSNRDIYNLIFEPGFSTAETVTNISGRGVGMDVVKKQIMKLKGLLEIDSELGHGTTITIRLPLTLAIVQSLLVEAHGEIFAIPLGSVIESIRISRSEIQKVGEAEVIKLRDKVLPLIHLDETLKLNTDKESLSSFLKSQRAANTGRSKRKKSDRYFVVVVGTVERPFGIVVDKLLNQQEMVIKSMGNLLQEVPCVAGGAVLGHGEVVLVLDIPELDYAFRAKSRTAITKELVS